MHIIYVRMTVWLAVRDQAVNSLLTFSECRFNTVSNCDPPEKIPSLCLCTLPKSYDSIPPYLSWFLPLVHVPDYLGGASLKWAPELLNFLPLCGYSFNYWSFYSDESEWAQRWSVWHLATAICFQQTNKIHSANGGKDDKKRRHSTLYYVCLLHFWLDLTCKWSFASTDDVFHLHKSS